GVHGAAGNNAGVVKGPGGDVYAGADGNVYKHTDSGWSKYQNGSWAPMQTPSAAQNRTQPATTGQGSLGAQQQRLADPNRQGQAWQNQNRSWAGQTANRGTYGQLQQDWHARGLGQQRQQQYQTWRSSGSGLFRRR